MYYFLNSCTLKDALPCSKLEKRVPKPLGEKYLNNPTTVGEKIRNKRLEKGLLQKNVADFIGVDEGLISMWELRKSNPSIQYYPKITEFLGYSQLK